MSADQLAVELRAVCTKAGRDAPLLDASLRIPTGSICVLAGHPRSGKTSALQVVCGLRKPTAGEVLLFGKRADSNLQKRVAYVPRRAALLPNMTLEDTLVAKGIALGISAPKETARRVAEICKLSGLKLRGRGASAEDLRHLGIALALVGSPDVLLLDDPLLGFGGRTGCELAGILRELHDLRGMTVVAATADPERLANLATRYASIEQGKIQRELSASRMRELCRKSICVRTASHEQDLASLEAALGNATITVRREGRDGEPYLEIVGASQEEVGSALHDMGVTVLEMRPIHRSMDEVLLGGGTEEASQW